MNEPIAEGWIGMAEAAELSGYSPAYVRRLANRGRIEARKVGRDWLIERHSLEAYKARMDGLGAEKHNPWRGDLIEQGHRRRAERQQAVAGAPGNACDRRLTDETLRSPVTIESGKKWDVVASYHIV